MSDPAGYTAVLPIGESTATHIGDLLAGERARRATRAGRRARPAAPPPTATHARVSTCSPRRHRGCTVRCWPPAPPGHSHVQLDGTLIRTDRSRALGPPTGIYLWWSGKPHRHGGNVPVVTAPDV